MRAPSLPPTPSSINATDAPLKGSISSYPPTRCGNCWGMALSLRRPPLGADLPRNRTAAAPPPAGVRLSGCNSSAFEQLLPTLLDRTRGPSEPALAARA
eukprot:scaffold255317_cov33-Tisochrysis_lutea.AAC.3